MFYFGAVDTIVALMNGQVIWTHDIAVQAAPSVDLNNSHVLMMDTSSILHCWDAMTGKELWSRTIYDVAVNSISVMPAISMDGNIFINNDNGIIKLSPDGTIIWMMTLNGTLVGDAPMITGDGTLLVSGIGSALVYALDPEDGSTIWTTNLVDWPTEIHVTEKSTLVVQSAYGYLVHLG